MSTLSVYPPSIEMASSETLPIRMDTSNLLGVGESPTSPTAVLTNLSTGNSYAAGLSGNASVSGNYVTQTVTALTGGQQYRLAVSFTAASGKVWTMELSIICKF